MPAELNTGTLADASWLSRMIPFDTKMYHNCRIMRGILFFLIAITIMGVIPVSAREPLIIHPAG